MLATRFEGSTAIVEVVRNVCRFVEGADIVELARLIGTSYAKLVGEVFEGFCYVLPGELVCRGDPWLQSVVQQVLPGSARRQLDTIELAKQLKDTIDQIQREKQGEKTTIYLLELWLGRKYVIQIMKPKQR